MKMHPLWVKLEFCFTTSKSERRVGSKEIEQDMKQEATAPSLATSEHVNRMNWVGHHKEQRSAVPMQTEG